MSEDTASPALETAAARKAAVLGKSLQGTRAAVVMLSEYPSDPRPRREAEALAGEGMEVDVICIKGKPSDATRECVDGVNVLRLPIYHKRGGKLAYFFQYGSFLTLSFLILALRTATRRYRLIHVHNMPDILVFSAVVPKLFGAKVILDLHDPMPELMQTIFGLDAQSGGVRLLKLLEKLSLGFADAIVTVSETFRGIFCSRSCPPGKARVVMNSPDEKIFPFAELPAHGPRQEDRPFVIMFHGSLVERHGLGLAVDALAKVRARVPNAVLRVYGKRTAHLDEVLGRVVAQGMQDCVEYRGPQSLNGIAAAIDECDLGIVPNLRSIFTELNTPTRVFEFLARGKPVIAPSGQGVREYFAPEEILYFSLGDSTDLASVIESAYRNPQAVHETVRKGQEVCRAHRWSIEKRHLLDLAEELMLSGSRRICSPVTREASVA